MYSFAFSKFGFPFDFLNFKVTERIISSPTLKNENLLYTIKVRKIQGELYWLHLFPLK